MNEPLEYLGKAPIRFCEKQVEKTMRSMLHMYMISMLARLEPVPRETFNEFNERAMTD